jgi:hypothetical protein
MQKLTEKQAQAILSNRVLVSNKDLIKKVRINSVSTEAYDWKNPVAGTNPKYKIVNTNALTEYGFGKAQELYNNGDYDLACNVALSFNADQELATKLLASRYATAEFHQVLKKKLTSTETDVYVTVIKSLTPVEVEEAPKAKFNFGSLKSTTETISSPVEEKEFA